MSASTIRPIECARRELACRSDELAAANHLEHAVERARVILLIVDRTARNAFAIALAIGLEARRFGSPHQWSDPIPLGIRGGEDFLCFAGDLDEAADSVSIFCRPAIACVASNAKQLLGKRRCC